MTALLRPAVRMLSVLHLCLLQAVLSNGLRVFLVEDHDVPLVKTSLLFRGGLRTSPPDKVMRLMMCVLPSPTAYPVRL